MDDRAWIREDTLTMQLAIPPDLRIYNWQKMSDHARTAQHCQVV